MRVKICGLMRPSDVAAAIDNGADALGFVVASPTSRRNLPLMRARQLMKAVPVYASKVAVTSSNENRILNKICTTLSPDVLQLHSHTRETIRMLKRRHPTVRLVVATPVRNGSSLAHARAASKISDAILADTLGPDGMGGTGRTHDWNLTATIRDEIFPHPLILAGGLMPDNVRVAIEKVRPHAVDVSSGVEKRVGVKDHLKIRRFIRNARGFEA